MITEPQLDGQRTPLQDLETLYIGGAERAVTWRARAADAPIEALWPATTTVHGFERTLVTGARTGLCATFKGSLTTMMARIILGSGQGNKHEANDE
jgi:hypothetical protein